MSHPSRFKSNISHPSRSTSNISHSIRLQSNIAQFETVKQNPIPVTHVGRSVAPLPEGAEGIGLAVQAGHPAMQDGGDGINNSSPARFCERCRGLAC